MITLGYLDTAESDEVTSPLAESPRRGTDAFRVYTSMHFGVHSVSETRVVLRNKKPSSPYQFMAFDGPEAEMAEIVALANEKLARTERRREIASSLILVDAPNIDDIWR